MDLTTTTATAALESFLSSRRECIAAGVNVGEIDRAKMRRFELELIRRAA